MPGDLPIAKPLLDSAGHWMRRWCTLPCNGAGKVHPVPRILAICGISGSQPQGSVRLVLQRSKRGLPRSFHSRAAVHDVILSDRPSMRRIRLWRKHYGAHKAAWRSFVHSYRDRQGWRLRLAATGFLVCASLALQPWFDLVRPGPSQEPSRKRWAGKGAMRDVGQGGGIVASGRRGSHRGAGIQLIDRTECEQEGASMQDLTGVRSHC